MVNFTFVWRLTSLSAFVSGIFLHLLTFSGMINPETVFVAVPSEVSVIAVIGHLRTPLSVKRSVLAAI